MNEHVDPTADTARPVGEPTAWLAVPDIVELTGVGVQTVRSWIADRLVLSTRRGPNHAVHVPADFLTPEGPLAALQGTIVVLGDSGLDDEEILAWLYRPDDTLAGGSAIAALLAGHKTEIRRRAQETAW